ncbi:helix-turn-helix transcriptional regulator [Idiomarina seosinensis]|uniref:HTH luxR-type domain-containing protein n=1 Tax=Idiomarina seosinensis TaxID=281739 RepID=A0A432ZG29_9GAMM|nr:response regulator transcription factor [Idiomarina seosinensis]RUO76935.1 hypothetical protein CWI81_00025 [Idiomarina seosinensis]
MLNLFITEQFNSPRWQRLDGECRVVGALAEAQAVINEQESSTEQVVIWLMADHSQVESICRSCVGDGYKVLVLYTKPDSDQMKRLIGLGARGYASAAASADGLAKISEVVCQGGLWLPDQFLANLVGLTQKTMRRRASDKKQLAAEHALAQLSKREADVCKAVLDGLTNNQIAERLFISERTVKEHLTQSFRKLDVKDRLQLVLKLNPRG